MLLFSLCNISNIAAMNQNISVRATEIVDEMQREENRVLGGSIIIIDNYYGSFVNYGQFGKDMQMKCQHSTVFS